MEREDIPKLIVSGLLFAFLVFLSIQIVHFYGRVDEAKEGYAAVKRSYDERKIEETRLEGDVRYFSNSENFAKELRARFNFRDVGEKTMILVPQEQE